MFGGSARARWFAVPVIALSVVGLTACGSGSVAPAASGTGTAAGVATVADAAAGVATAAQDGAGTPAEMVAFDECMSEHGVTRPERPAGAAGSPDGGSGGPAGDQRPAGPRPGGGGAAANGPGGTRPDPATAPPGVDQNTWTTARAACASLAPEPPAAPGN